MKLVSIGTIVLDINDDEVPAAETCNELTAGLNVTWSGPVGPADGIVFQWAPYRFVGPVAALRTFLNRYMAEPDDTVGNGDVEELAREIEVIGHELS